MNKSIPLLNYPCEFVDVKPFNPLISKCVIKVLYVGDTPNRNNTIITKDTAKKIANSLPGSPIAGYYCEESKDFNRHDMVLEIKDGKLQFTRLTRPYGFVDLNARVWFQKYLDNDSIEREYLVTEGWIWTGQYPESQRIIDEGNNQSMELDRESVKGVWADSYNCKQSFFIINEAIISELCILGTEVEPCFEGASITKFSLSLEDEFKSQVYSLMTEFNKIIEEGGTLPMLENEIQEVVSETEITEQVVVSEPQVENEYAAKKNEEEEGKSVKKDTENSEELTEDKEEKKCSKCGKPQSECECKEEKEDKEEDKKQKYSLEEIPEYVELAMSYNALVAERDNLQATVDSLNGQIASLSKFKLAVERKEKEAMIATFSMLSDEDKFDVVTNIDTYSLDDIEAKLSVICVRKRVSFSVNETPKTEEPVTTYNLSAEALVEDVIPDWVKAVRQTAKNMNN